MAINRWHQSDIKVGEFWREISEHIVYVTWDITTAMKLLPDQGVKNERNLIEVGIDLNTVVDDKVQVEVNPKKINQETIVYHIPAIVPGTPTAKAPFVLNPLTIFF